MLTSYGRVHQRRQEFHTCLWKEQTVLWILLLPCSMGHLSFSNSSFSIARALWGWENPQCSSARILLVLSPSRDRVKELYPNDVCTTYVRTKGVLRCHNPQKQRRHCWHSISSTSLLLLWLSFVSGFDNSVTCLTVLCKVSIVAFPSGSFILFL